MILTNNPEWAESMRRFRNHGMTTDGRQREEGKGWRYDVPGPGWNYRLTDFQCVLGTSQLKRLPDWLEHRRSLATTYAKALESRPGITMLTVRENVEHAWHLLVVRVNMSKAGIDRDALFMALRGLGIGANVHYIPLTMLTRFKSSRGTCPVAEAAGEAILTLPIHQGMLIEQVHVVTDAIDTAIAMVAHLDHGGR